MFSIFFMKRWLSFENAIKPYGNYYSVDYSVTWVDPQDIIGLSLNAWKVRNAEKMKRLKDSVSLNGWINQNPFDFHLF